MPESIVHHPADAARMTLPYGVRNRAAAVALRPAFPSTDCVAWAIASWTASPQPVAAPSIDRLMDAAMHGVRNSLSAVLLGVDLLARRGDTQEPGVVLDHIGSAATRAHEQAEELADFSRLAAGRSIATVLRRFSPHLTVAQAVAVAQSHNGHPVIEHDRLGEGDGHGDAQRIAQFVRLALDELEAPPGAATRRIVVSEVSGEHFHIAVHAAAPAADVAPPAPAPASRPASESRRALMRAIAQAHGGGVRFMPRLAGSAASIEGWFAGSRAQG